jgi:FdrA protein
MVVRHRLRPQTYFDSVTLMLITSQVRTRPGVDQVVVGMGTDYNLDSLKRLDLYLPELAAATPNDLLICVRAADAASADAAVAAAELALSAKRSGKAGGVGGGEPAPATQEGGARVLPEANISLISVPGTFAAAETEKALEAGRHVMLFSDNVSLDDERRLKELAVSKGLLVMGPDCGTAIINGVPLAFANAVRRGPIGLVAASGTGLQEVSSLIHRLGSGVSQAIGVGGRDLSAAIGGRMTLFAARALATDPETKVITLISKPPAAEVLPRLYDELKGLGKPVVIYFIGADPGEITRAGFIAAEHLEDAAVRSVTAALGKPPTPLADPAAIAATGRAEAANRPGPFLRALYSGGTLCDEAQRLLQPSFGEIFSNTPVPGCRKLADLYKSTGHTIIDLGDDDFTRGKAHPMIDPSLRQERIDAETRDPEVGLIALDVVLGYGAHPDMAGQMATAVTRARAAVSRPPIYAATLLGTEDDPQNYRRQHATLTEAGIHVFPSNVALVRFIRACFGKEV